MYNNKNMSSGYFTESLLNPCLDNYNFNKNDVFSDGPQNINPNVNINCYYPHISGDKYLKQISNANSKYNNSYLLKMKPIYKICKKFWGPSRNLSSLEPNSLRSKYNNELKKSLPKKTLKNDYDRVVLGSDR